MPYEQVRPVNLFADFMAGKEAANAERVAKRQNALGDLQLRRAENLNALSQNPDATPEQYIRAGDAQTGMAIQNSRQSETDARKNALAHFAGLARHGLKIADPNARRAFLKQATATFGPHLSALGGDPAKSAAELDSLSDDELLQRMQQVAQFAPPKAPLELSAGATLVDPDTRTPLYTAPTAPPKRTVEWKDAGNRLVPVYSDTGEDVPNLAPKPKGATPAQVGANDNRNFTRADKLRDEYNAASKDFVAIGDSYTRLQEAARDPSAAGDLSLIFQYMKMLDPGSVVREQEFANAQNAAGVPDRIRNAYNRTISGERLNPNQRRDFLNNAQKLYTGQRSRHETTVKARYTEIAKRFQVNPQDVVGDFDVITGAVNGGQGGGTPSAGAAEFVYQPGRGLMPAR